MFGFGKNDDAIEMQVLRLKRKRGYYVYPLTREIEAAQRIFKNIPAKNDTVLLENIFSETKRESEKEKKDLSQSLYNIFYRTEQLIAEAENRDITRLENQIKLLREEAAKDKKNPKLNDEKIQELTKDIEKTQVYSYEKRRRLYEGFFEYLHKKHGDDEKKINSIIHGMTDWKVREDDAEHARIVNTLTAFNKARVKHEAYGNPWYMLGVGAFMTIAGGALLAASLITGFAAPYVFVFGFAALSGLTLAFLGGKKTSEEMLAYRVNAEADTALRSPARIAKSKENLVKHDSILNRLTWQSAPFFLVGLAAITLVVVDFAMGGPLNAIGSAIQIDLFKAMGIPEYSLSVAINRVDFAVSTPVLDSILNPIFQYFINPIFNYFLIPATEMVVNALGAVISYNALQFMAIGIIASICSWLLSKVTAVSDNKTFVRAHSMITQFVDTAKWTFGICGGLSMFFGYSSLLSLPMIALIGGAGAFAYSAYKMFIKGEEYITTPASPGIGGMFAQPEKKIDCKTVMLYSAVAVVVACLSLFVFATNPIGFSVLVLAMAFTLTLANDQILAIAAARDAKSDKEAIHVNIQDLNKRIPTPTPSADNKSVPMQTFAYKTASGKSAISVAPASAQAKSQNKVNP